MLARRWQPFAALLLAALWFLPDGRADDAARAEEAAQRDAKVLGWLIKQSMRAIAQPVAPNDAPPIDDQRRQQIEQHAKQMERQLQPSLNGELELVRRTCGELAPEARQRILAAGREAVTATARGFTERQFAGRLGQDDFDPRREIRVRLEQALGDVAEPKALAAYRQEIERREARLGEAARVAIVASIDRQVQLSAEQRRLIEEALANKWQASWARDVGVRSDMRVNGLPPAPDYAAESIEPHLDRDQVAIWKKWCRQASSRNLGRMFQWNIDGQGLQQLDPWWGR